MKYPLFETFKHKFVLCIYTKFVQKTAHYDIGRTEYPGTSHSIQKVTIQMLLI